MPNAKQSVHRFLTKHEAFIIKCFAFAGSMAGNLIGMKVGEKVTKVGKARTAPKTPERLKGRTLITEEGRYPLVVVYHDADKAGPHLDVHIGEMSLIYRVPTELKEALQFGRDGYLSKKNRDLLMDHLKSEIERKRPVPQNFDHAFDQVHYGWVNGGAEQNGYGAGKTRQVIHESQVDIYKIDNAIELFAPSIDPHRGLYIFPLEEKAKNGVRILIWGQKNSNPPPFEERLNLKSLDPEHINVKKLEGKIDWKTSTAKYDGSSGYLVIGPKGTTVWSPRKGKSTGEQIEYTHKLMNLHELTSDEVIIAMGEILFTDEYGSYLKGAKISGILNSNDVLPEETFPEIRLYRVDSVDGVDVHNLPFWENRTYQEVLASGCPDILKPAELMTPVQAKKAGMEGVVVAPPDGSINKGYKVKWWLDPNDWVIKKVKLRVSEKGNIAGVVACKSLDSDKDFNLGPTALGNQQYVKHIMENPDLYEGTVLKVVSRHGFEGRSAKVIGEHDDKGLAAV